MGTPFSDIYNRAVFRFKDYDFLKIDDFTREEILRRYLQSAEADFERICRYDLTKIDEERLSYEESLDNETIEVLACGLAFYWMSSYAMNNELFRNSMSTKDYTTFSPANLLREISGMRDALYKEFNRKMVRYSYSKNDISTRGV